MPTLTDTPTGRAVRLTFSADIDGGLRLVSQTPVDVLVGGLDTALAPPPGGYLELHDDAGTALGRVSIGSDFAVPTEVVPEEPDGPITQVPAVAGGGFTIVVPVPATAVDVVAVRVSPGTREAAAPGAPLPGLQGPAGPGAAAPAPPELTEVARFRLDSPVTPSTPAEN